MINDGKERKNGFGFVGLGWCGGWWLEGFCVVGGLCCCCCCGGVLQCWPVVRLARYCCFDRAHGHRFFALAGCGGARRAQPISRWLGFTFDVVSFHFCCFQKKREFANLENYRQWRLPVDASYPQVINLFQLLHQLRTHPDFPFSHFPFSLFPFSFFLFPFSFFLTHS